MPEKKIGRSTVYNSGLTQDYDEVVSKENKEIIKEFVDYLKSVNKSPQTIKQYEAQLRVWAVWCAKYNNNTFFVDMKKRQFVRFFSYLQDDLEVSSNRIGSLRAVLSSMSNFIERIYDDEYPHFRNIVKVLEPVYRHPVREKSVIEIEDIKNCLDNLVADKKYQTAAFLAVLASCGARKAEVLQFKVSDFTEKHLVFNGSAYETDPVRSKGKGKEGTVVSKIVFKNIVDVDKYLNLWMQKREADNIDCENLFVVKRDGKYYPANISTANSFVKTIENVMGIPNYSHAYRHACCTYLLRIGTPKEIVQQIFRWKTDQVPTYDDRDKDEELSNFMVDFASKIGK